MKASLKIWISSGLFLVASFVLVRCGGSSSGSDGTNSEVATAAIGGTSSASEGTVASSHDVVHPPGFWLRLKRVLDPLPEAWAVPLCDWSTLTSNGCVSNAVTLTFGGCSTTADHAISITGSETLTWSAGCCTTSPLGAGASCSFTRRTMKSDASPDPMIRAVGQNAVTLDTEDSSGYAATKTGGFTVTCQGVTGNTTCAGQRQIVINGAHYTGQSGRAQWDHTVSTDVPLVVQGSNGTRVVTSGTVRVQDNLHQMSSVSIISQPLTHTAGCCYPTGGEISTTYSGGQYDGKTETLTYGPGCGAATLNNTEQQQTGLTLHHCL